MCFRAAVILAAIAAANAAAVKSQVANTSSTSCQCFQTSPELFAGPTPTGTAPFLAQVNPAPYASVSYIPAQPLETQVPIQDAEGANIFQQLGNLSPYFPNPDGFGVDEHALPSGSKITALYMLSRHGSRYPTSGSSTTAFAKKIANAAGKFTATGQLAFLNSWKYELGADILVPVGKQELFNSGTLHYYNYGHLYPNNGTKIIARSTTEDRMVKSAEYFLAGFFGLEWTNNATLELIIDHKSFNNSLSGNKNCPNANNANFTYGATAQTEWVNTYLQNATQRIQAQISGWNWTVTDTYNAQSLCAYETVGLGYSDWCGLFTYEEWQGYEYAADVTFAGNNGFQSPTGRAVGIGWVQELLARLQHHTIDGPVGTVNYTLDSSTAIFPLDQTLNFDFSHDTTIFSVLVAFGFTQFSQLLPATQITPRDLIVSHIVPFAARLDIEIIQAPQPVSATRQSAADAQYAPGGPTTYIHFILNQRTLPLGLSFPECGNRTDGWCELGTFLRVQSTKLAESDFDFACFGKYPATGYGEVTNGVPVV